MKILVTGGAGYIGSAATKALLDKGHDVIVVDNLTKGLPELVDKRAKFYELDLIDELSLEKVFDENEIEAVIHFAGYKSVGESMNNPIKYSANIIGTINLLNLMANHNVRRIVFSSSAAVYGNVQYSPVDENHPLNPINFYGFTKMECEKLIEEYSKIYRIKYVCLRYFNVAGDAGLNYFDPAAENVFPILMETAFGIRKEFKIYGNDYNTPDGTCLRDYIDINDLVEAHILALNSNDKCAINLGTSKGVSVLELVKETEKVIGRKIPHSIGPRRAGDPATIVASNERASKFLKWTPKKSLNDMIRSTYEAYKKNVKK